jgi:pyruvate formate lyase activating enzyme
MSEMVCNICPHHCSIPDGGTGFCRARGNVNGSITAINYGRITSIALDPIEKKPLKKFHPGSYILSVGSFGCNLRCPFCQNHEISMMDSDHADVQTLLPDELVNLALSLRTQDNIGIAYTYNEPLIGYEYVRDCAQLAHKKDLKNIVVTNGYICAEPLMRLLPDIDAMNIDLKAFSEQFYENICGDLETVKHTIELAAAQCHVEVTTLIIPQENDSEYEIRSLSQWLASVRSDIPLHLSRFFPHYRMMDKDITKADELRKLASIARESLQYVYIGNC